VGTRLSVQSAGARLIAAGPEFDAAVLALVASVEHGEPFAEEDFQIMVRGLGRFLRARFGTLPRADVVDCVNEAVTRFIAAIQAGQVLTSMRPAGYVTRIAERVALDRVDRSPPAAIESNVEDVPDEDDPESALLDALASRQDVLKLMIRVRERGEHELNDLIRAWRDLAQPGKVPSRRQLGSVLQISHTEVGRRIERLRAFMGG
jgi:DNA-directed RNA polymerase specialized sigma24 family protein